MSQYRFRTCWVGVVLAAALCVSGCLFGANSPDSSQERSRSDTGPASTDTSAVDTGDAGGADVTCGPDAGAECACNFQNDSDGVCGEARRGSGGECQKPPEYESEETKCDKLDNDCDGVVDEGCPCPYKGRSDGVCGTAKLGDDGKTCQEPAAYEETESSCDAKDNDCDGDVDGEDSDLECSCDPETSEPRECYTGPEGTAGTGICRKGEQACTDNSTWEPCRGDQTPREEGGGANCGDSRDNDCDGVINEGCSCDYEGNSEGVCAGQVRTPEGECPEPSRYEDTESSCGDGVDNDCDGDIDCNDSDCEGLLGFCE